MNTVQPTNHAPLEARFTKLADRTDIDELVRTMENEGKVLVKDFLREELARRLYERFNTWNIWNLVTRIQNKHQSFDARQMDKLGLKRQAALQLRIANELHENGFQYCFERFPLYDYGRSNKLNDPVLKEAYALLRSDEFLNFGRTLSRCPDIVFADGQMTRYRNGHFLSQHTDYDQGMKRVAAYVINLSPGWKADFGGQLQFLDKNGDVETVFKPTFNSLTLFKVPRPHLVTSVAPFARQSRLAITGWLRAEIEPQMAAE